MSSNIDENDLDFDASVSSVNSDNEKVDSTLIKRILSEMKSEFNRSTANNSDEQGELQTLAISSMDTENEGSELANEDETEDGKDSISKTNFNGGDEELSNEPIETDKKIFSSELEEDEQKPRLILTLRTTEENREMGGRLSRKSYNKNDSLHASLTDLSDSSLNDKNEEDHKGSMWETRSRRSLRSSSRLPDKDIDTPGMKRSSRRFSKEQCRESVLQNAIARKEKSFSSFNQTEERSSRRGARSPRQSFGDPKANRPLTRSKSPKGLSETCEIFDSNTLLAIKSETVTDLNLTHVKLEMEEMSGDSNDTTNMNSASTNSQTSEPSVDVKPSITDKNYTKTGKRRKKKYFKGLKYSLTTGGSVKKRNLNVAKKKKNVNVAPITAANLEQSVEYRNEDNYYGTNETDVDFKIIENATVSDSNGKGLSGEPDKSDGTPSVSYVTDEIRCESPALGDICLSTSNKRKYQPEREESGRESEKRCHLDVPSPCQGDVEAEPDKPEATAIGVGSAGLCLCNSRAGIYASIANCSTDLYCHAVDWLDTRLIGCCNTVDKDNAMLLRPSSRVPFLVMCDVHYHRLQRHNCCPGCGVFCTQGKFMQCGAYHQYHKECQLEEEGKEACPHCGSDQVYEVEISLGAHKYPVFFPQQTPSKKTPSAKMTFTYKTECSEEEKKKELEQELNLALVPPSSLILPSGLQISSQGLPPSLDKDKLEHLLHVACSIDVLSLPRYTVRNMYQVSKQGEAEKVVHMIAAGLNVNHVFREYAMSTCLHAASLGGHLTVVHLLLQAGAHTDVLDRDQNTPLMLACSNSHNDVVKYLVKAGASVTFKGGDGMTALHLAAKAGNVEACHYLISNPSTPRSFIDSVDDGRWTPLVWAAEHKHYDVIKFLLEKRADPLVRDAEQNIALHWAALSGCIDISEALLNYGSDVNSTNAHADTPLHIAARQNAYECVVLLLTRGARVDVHNRLGHLPLDCVPDAPNDTYNAIKLNVEMRNLALNVQKRTFKILTNDITKGYEANPVQCVNTVDSELEPTDFIYVTENCFTSNINVDRTITSLQSCKCKDMCISGGCMCSKICLRCWYDDEGKLLPEFNFADPPMLFECNQACACNKLMCKNRVVQHGITARFQLFRTKSNKGWGVRTLRLIPKGAYVCEYIGEIISDCEADTREDDSYLFDLDNRDGETYCIDARRYGNIARFINHSCAPNLLPVRVFIDHQDLHFPRIAFFANRDIQAQEELGFDYGEKFWIIKSKLFTCTCGAEKCKYSETTIKKTLANYNRKMQLEDSQ